MTQTSFMGGAHSGYRITNPERFRRTACATECPPFEESNEMTAFRLTEEIIREYAGEMADALLSASAQSLETAALWDEAGYEPPHDVKLLVEILHRMHAGT